MKWTSIGTNAWEHVFKRNFIAGEKTGGRYHGPIFDGGHSDTLGADRIFSFCHHEYWIWNGLDSTHTQTDKAANEGKAALKEDLPANSMISSDIKNEDYGNKDGDYIDGIALFMKRI